MRLFIAIFAFAAAFAAISPPCFTQAASAPTVATQPASPFLSAGTGVQVKLLDELKSGSTPVGSAVHFQVAKDVCINGTVLIPNGAEAFGQVTESKKAAIFGQAGKLAFTCDYLVLPSGQQVALNPQPMENRGHDDRTATVMSAVLDNWADGLTTGGNVKVKKGQEFTVYVDHDTALAPPATAAQPVSNTSTGPSAQARPAAPIDPGVIGSGKHVIVALNDGSSYYGTVNKLAGDTYTLANSQGTVAIKSADIKSVQYPDN